MEENNNMLYQTLRERFDRIYVLTLSNRADRRTLIEKQFRELGLPLPDADSTGFIRYHYATPFPYNALIADAFNKSGRGQFTKPNEYDCSRNHYSIVKICYDLGFKNCLILEDDILLLRNSRNTFILSKYINMMPEDYDICQMGGFTADPRILKYLNNNKVHWFKHPDVGLWNASAYALSRRGMEFYLTFMDKIKFWVADGPLYKAPLSDKIINTYASDVPLAIQADKQRLASDIRDESNDSIDYNTQNKYEEYVNLEDYFSL